MLVPLSWLKDYVPLPTDPAALVERLTIAGLESSGVKVFGVPVHKIRVRTPNLGGGFGNKFDFYGEEVIAAVLSRRTGRPVKLIEDRRDKKYFDTWIAALETMLREAPARGELDVLADAS